MARRDDPNPFDEEEVNPFSKDAGPGSKSHFPSLSSLPLGFGSKHDATVDIPLEAINDTKKKAEELATLEEDLKRRETDIKRREDALSSGGVSRKEKNRP